MLPQGARPVDPFSAAITPPSTLHISHATADTSHPLFIYTPARGEDLFRDINTIDQTDITAILALVSQTH